MFQTQKVEKSWMETFQFPADCSPIQIHKLSTCVYEYLCVTSLQVWSLKIVQPSYIWDHFVDYYWHPDTSQYRHSQVIHWYCIRDAIWDFCDKNIILIKDKAAWFLLQFHANKGRKTFFTSTIWNHLFSLKMVPSCTQHHEVFAMHCFFLLQWC